MTGSPLFSIVIPSYNRATFIGTAIDSVLHQAFADFELLVIDDGSEDNTADVVRSFDDKRLRYFWKPNGERAAARNYGVLHANGDYITFLDSDDFVYPHYLSTAKDWIAKSNFPEFCHLAYEIEDSQTKNKKAVVLKADVNSALLTGNPLSCIGIFLRQDVARAHPFPEERALAGSEDWVLWLQLAARFKIHHCPTISACIRQHGKRSVLNFEPEKLITRINLAAEEVLADAEVQRAFPNTSAKIEAHLHLYLALHLVMGGDRRAGAKYFWRALYRQPQLLFSRKSFALLYKLIQSNRMR